MAAVGTSVTDSCGESDERARAIAAHLAKSPDTCRSLLLTAIRKKNDRAFNGLILLMDAYPTSVFSHLSWEVGNMATLVVAALLEATPHARDAIVARIPADMKRTHPIPEAFTVHPDIDDKRTLVLASKIWIIPTGAVQRIMDNCAYLGNHRMLCWLVLVLHKQHPSTSIDLIHALRQTFVQAARGGKVGTMNMIGRIISGIERRNPGTVGLPAETWRAALNAAYVAFQFTTADIIRKHMDAHSVPNLTLQFKRPKRTHPPAFATPTATENTDHSDLWKSASPSSPLQPLSIIESLSQVWAYGSTCLSPSPSPASLAITESLSQLLSDGNGLSTNTEQWGGLDGACI